MNRDDLAEFGDLVERLTVEFSVQGRIVGGASEGLHKPSAVALRLCKASRTLHRAAESDCNDGGGNAKRDKLVTRTKEAVWFLCTLLDSEAGKPGRLKPVFDGDPRGYVLKLALPSGRSNELGGLWGVPPL